MKTSGFVLRVVAVAFALGLGTAVATGHGVALAEPSSADGSSSSAGESSDSASSDSSTPSESKSESDDAATNDAEPPDVTSEGTQQDSDVDSTADPDPDAVAEGDESLGPVPDPEAHVSEEDESKAESDGSGTDGSESGSTAATAAARRAASPEPTVTDTSRSQRAPVARKPAADDAIAESASQPAVAPASARTTALTDAVPLDAEAPEPTVATAAVTPVAMVSSFVSGVVSGLLQFFGLTPAITNGPAAPIQSTSLAGLLQLARRDIEYSLFDWVPTAAPVQISENADGVVTGTVGAVYADPDRLTYQVTEDPTHGTVTVDAEGSYTYTPNAAFAAAGGTDTFTVVVDDNIRSLIQLGTPGFPGFNFNLFRSTGQVAVPVRVTVAPGVAVTTAQVGVGPSGVAVSPDGKRAYVTNAYGNSVSVIDTATNEIIATITAAGNFPVAIAVSPDGGRAYVANAYGGTVSVIDTTTQKVTASIDVGPGATPAALAVSPDGGSLYVADDNADSVSVIDTATNTVTATIAVGSKPQAVAFSPNGARAYVANAGGNSVSVIDTATKKVIATIGLSGAANPGAIAISPDGKRAYVAGYENGTVSVIDTSTNTVSAVISVGSNPAAVAVSPDGTRVYIANSGGTTVSAIDTADNTVHYLEVGAGPDAIAVSPDGTKLYVPNFADATVSVLSIAPGSLTVPPPVGATVYTRGFDVYNLTQHPVTFTGYTRGDAQDIASAPQTGTVIQPGSAAHFEIVFSFFHDNIVDANFTSPNGAVYSATMEVQGVFGQGLGTCSVSGGGGATCSPTFERPIDQFLLFDAPGTVVEIGGENAQAQADVLNRLCLDGSRSSCEFKPTTPKGQEKTYSEYHRVSPFLPNPFTNQNLTLAISESQAVSQSDSVQVGIKTGFKLGDIVTFEINSTYGHTWTATHTFTYTASTPVPPRTEMWWEASDPVYKVFGDFTLEMGNTTWILRDVWFETPYGSDTAGPFPRLRLGCRSLGGECPPPVDDPAPASVPTVTARDD